MTMTDEQRRARDVRALADDAVVEFARCPEHGLHGCREECFVCGEPVERVPMVPLDVALGLKAEALRWERTARELAIRLGETLDGGA